MERTMSVEDKIRRAEERYYRKKESEMSNITKKKKSQKEKTNIKLFKKMIKQIIICLAIYGVFYLIINNNYIFSEDFTNKAREILSQDINFRQIYSIISSKINELNNQINKTSEGSNKEDNQNIDNSEQEKQKEDIKNNNENIGGAEENLVQEGVQNTNQEITEELNNQSVEINQLSQMEQDAKYIKNTINFIKPVNGKISSIYGLRNPTTSTVPKDHKGTDIATEIGTKIVSATDGTVVVASTEGDYGNHLKIQINDVIIVYAHCNKLYVKQGDVVKQGQEIAEVGATGNVTGPHLHFEVRYQNRYINPQLILEL